MLSFCTRCEGPPVAKNGLLFPMVRPTYDFQRCSIFFIGDGSWSMCKADLSNYLQHHQQSIFNFTVGHSISFLRFHFIFISPTFTKKISTISIYVFDAICLLMCVFSSFTWHLLTCVASLEPKVFCKCS